MALHNPSGLYQGQAPLNPLPYVNIALQARARKQAREDALDRYYRELPDKLNDKGLRDQEVPILNDIKQEIFEYGQKNKEALKNPKIDNGAAQHGLNLLFRKGQSVTRLSQNAAQRNLNRGKMWLSKENQFLLNNDDYLKALHYEDLPVTDPEHRELKDEEFLNQRPFDQNKQVNFLRQNFKYGEQENRVNDPENPLLDVVTYTPKLDKETIESIYAHSANQLHDDYTFKNKIEKDLAGSNQLPKLNEISKKYFGHPIQSDEDIAGAYNISILPVTTPSKQKRVQDIDAIKDRALSEWLMKNKITFGQSMAKISANKGQGSGDEDLGYLTDEYFGKYGASFTPKEEQQVRTLTGLTPQGYVEVSKIHPNDIGTITGKDRTKRIGGVEPVDLNGKEVYFVDEQGNWVGKNGTIDREAVRRKVIETRANTKVKIKQENKKQEYTPKKGKYD